MINFATRHRINNALTSKIFICLIASLMSLNLYMKTFVFVVLNERIKTFSMLLKKYLTLNANTVNAQRAYF